MRQIRNNRSGFTIVEGLLIILVLAVIGFGGYYVWHSQKKDTKADTVIPPATQQTTKKTTSTQAPQNQYLKISELGIELPLTSQISDLTYSTTGGGIDPTAGGGTVNLLSSTTLGALYHQIDANCLAEAYPIEPNLLSRTAPSVSQSAKATATVNGNTYYLFAKGGHGYCADDWNPTTAQQAQIDAYMNAVYSAVTNAKAL